MHLLYNLIIISTLLFSKEALSDMILKDFQIDERKNISDNHIENELHSKVSQNVPKEISPPPSHLLRIQYEFGTFEIEPGMKIDIQKTKYQPDSLIWPNDPKKFYTLIMLDLDVPGRNIPESDKKPILHWVVGNIPGSGLYNGETVAQFISPVPPQGSGFHRFVFLVYKQSKGRISYRNNYYYADQTDVRRNFSLKKFIDEYKLVKKSVAGNYIQVEA